MSWTQANYHFDKATEWAQDNCPSFRGVEVMDISDFSMTNDLLARFEFSDTEDAIMFRLAWSGFER